MESLISILALLACPIGMGLMAWLMMRRPQSGGTMTAATRPAAARHIRLCLNPTVVGLLVMSGIAIWLLAPRILGLALPLLILAACPISMLLMMRSMNGGQCAPQHLSSDREQGRSSTLEGEAVVETAPAMASSDQELRSGYPSKHGAG